MRIALVCPYGWDAPGGVQAHVAHLAANLAAEHEVQVIAPHTGRSATSGTADPVGVVGIGRAHRVPFNQSVAPIALSPRAGHRVRAALRAFDPDVVHVHEPVAGAVPLAALGGRPPAAAARVATFHTWSDRARLYRFARPVGRRIANGLDARIAVSAAARDYAAHALGVRSQTFTIVPNGVAVDAFAAAEPLSLRDPDRPLLLFVGRLEPRKGLDVAVRAFLRLRVDRPTVRLCVVGEGAERSRCQAMIPPAVRPDVLFVGRVDEAELPRYHASADVFLAPAYGGESFGIVLLEAMAAGLPVVASDIPGYRSVLTDGRQGRLTPPGDAVTLADALAALLDNPKLRAALAAEGRRTAAGYAWPTVTQTLVEVYRRCLAGS